MIGIGTLTRYPTLTVRARLAVQTVSEAQKFQYPIVVVDGGSCLEFLDAVRSYGVAVFPEPKGGAAADRRLAMAEAFKLAKRKVSVWIEPEKHILIRELPKVCAPLLNDKADFVLPHRTEAGFASYPSEQQHAEAFGNAFFNALVRSRVSCHIDSWFGPMAMNERSLLYVLNYGDDYGGQWDGLSVPRLRIIAAGLRVSSVEVDYLHPSEQTAEETGDVSWMMKRLKQLANLLPALHQEAQKLGLI